MKLSVEKYSVEPNIKAAVFVRGRRSDSITVSGMSVLKSVLLRIANENLVKDPFEQTFM